ncbi:MAG: tetratricopeptide repeat protein [Acidobacteria bacterium]|nr:tetratricopeptide repeat protein [Acidobacteriota bacterium]
MSATIRSICLSITLVLCATSLMAEENILVLNVANTSDEVIPNVSLKCKGDAPAAGSDRNGTARLKLPFGTRPGSSVVLQIVAGDWVMISPWDGRVIIPPFDNNAQNFVSIVIAKKSDRQILTSGKAVEAIVSRVTREIGSKMDRQISEEERRLVLEMQAREFGLTPDEVDRAIREWSRKVTDPYQKGLAELYASNYPEATRLLTASLDQKIREIEVLQNQAANNAFFLGEAQMGQGQYTSATEAFKKALALRPDDGVFLNSLSIAYRMAGNLKEAERAGERAVISKGGDPRFGQYHPATAIATLNLALLYQEEGKNIEAEQIFKQALLTTERGFGPDHPEVARCLDYFADFLDRVDRKSEAAEKRTRAGAIRSRFEQQTRDKTIADSKQLLKLKEQESGPDHPDIAQLASTLGSLYLENGQLDDAESLFKRALSVREKTVGKDHLDTAGDLQKLASLYQSQRKFTAAEPFARRALDILEKNLGPGDPYRVIYALDSYAVILRGLGRTNEALKYEARAKESREKQIRSIEFNPVQQSMPNRMNAPNMQAPPIPAPNPPAPKKPEKPKPEKPF